MSTLLLTLAGPMQAWGAGSRFKTRATEIAPTKSGVVGLIASALGLDRGASLDRFDGARFGVRIDRPGRLERDFQTAVSLDGKTRFPLSSRYYLADAVFVAGLEHDDAQVAEFAEALRRPAYPLFLGRRAFPPAGPIPVSVVPEPLEVALAKAPWAAPSHLRSATRAATVELDAVLEASPGERADEVLRDEPVTFDASHRIHRDRPIVHRLLAGIPNPDAAPADVSASAAPARPGHDPMSVLGGDE